jgi:hypothetical protein
MDRRSNEIKGKNMICPLCGRQLEEKIWDSGWIVYFHPTEIKCSYKIQIKDNK